jgi:hypothetical protein
MPDAAASNASFVVFLPKPIANWDIECTRSVFVASSPRYSIEIFI